MTDLLTHVVRNLEATRPNTWAHGSNEAAARSAKRSERRLYNTGHHATPSRVNRGHLTSLWIGNQHRDAVCHPHGDSVTGFDRNEGIGGTRKERRRIPVALDHMRAMHLCRLVETRQIKPHRVGQRPAIFLDPEGIETPAKIELPPVRGRPQRESMRKPSGLKNRGNKYGEARRHGRSWYHGSVMARQQDPFIGRDVLNGQFQILQKIGSGGMGSVYKALQPAMNRMVAIKILHPKLASRKDLVSRFRREARAMSHLTHPNTVKVYLYGELEDGSLYIVMEYLEGKNLNQTVRAEGPMPLERALPILIQACNALDEAHRAGIIHRDLKPENIFVTNQGGMKDFAKVLDFGLAKVTEREMRPGSLILTQEGMVFGTPEFMSPEQAQGRSLTPGSDIYSLAIILYEVLTGKLPFDAKNPMEFIQLHVTTKPKPINERVPGRTFPPLLWTVLSKALEKRTEDRYQSAAEFAHALSAVLAGATVVPPLPSGDPRPMMPSAQVFPTPLASPAVLRESSLPRVDQGPAKLPLGLFVGVAFAFLVIGAILAAVLLKMLGK